VCLRILPCQRRATRLWILGKASSIVCKTGRQQVADSGLGTPKFLQDYVQPWDAISLNASSACVGENSRYGIGRPFERPTKTMLAIRNVHLRIFKNGHNR